MKIKLSQRQNAALNRALSKYQNPFHANPSYIDMREMSKNFSNGVIPWNEINDLLDIMIGPPPVSRNSVDPTNDPCYTVSLEWKPFSAFGILSEIQRDMIPSHIYEIELDFDGKKISVILAMEDPVTGLICPFDGHHTARELDRQGWTKAPVAVLRAPKHMVDQDPLEARNYLMREAGEAFLSINMTHKKPVSGYDQFVIKNSYGDPDAISINNILISHKTQAKRIAKGPGDISHYPFLWSAYNLHDSNYNKGRYLDMALGFHRKTWPNEQVYGATLIGLANFFHKCEKAKVNIDQQFINDLESALKGTYRLSKFTHDGYKKAYQAANPYGSAGDELIVTCGFVHTYNKHVSKVKLYTPELQFKVK